MKHYLLLIALVAAFAANAQLAHPVLDPDHDYGWEEWGEGTMIDGWISQACGAANGADYREYPITVQFQRSTTPAGFIRIVEPWLQPTSWFIQSGLSITPGYDLIIEIADNGVVIIMPQRTGYSALHPVSKSQIDYIVNNWAGYYLTENDDIDKALLYDQQYPQHATTYENGIITVPLCMWSVVRANEEISAEDVGGAGDGVAIIYTPDSAGVPSVEVGESQDSDTPAEYYTLTGMRVDKPSRGNLYLERRGSQVSKVLYR